MSGEKTFTTTEDDLVAGNKLHARQLWNRRAILRGWFLALVVLSLLSFGFCERVGWIEIVGVPLVATAWIAAGWFVAQATFARAAKKSFGELEPFMRPTTVGWDGEVVRFSSERGESHDNWTNYHAWAADDRSILLYQAANSFITIPVRDLGADARAEIVEALKAVGVRERSAR